MPIDMSGQMTFPDISYHWVIEIIFLFSKTFVLGKAVVTNGRRDKMAIAERQQVKKESDELFYSLSIFIMYELK